MKSIPYKDRVQGLAIISKIRIVRMRQGEMCWCKNKINKDEVGLKITGGKSSLWKGDICEMYFHLDCFEKFAKPILSFLKNKKQEIENFKLKIIASKI
jgi:hypothetical protein